MGKDDTGAKGRSDKDSNSASETDKKTASDENEAPGSDSSNELEPVRSKKGEPADNLHRRSEWFQKRHGGG